MAESLDPTERFWVENECGVFVGYGAFYVFPTPRKHDDFELYVRGLGKLCGFSSVKDAKAACDNLVYDLLAHVEASMSARPTVEGRRG